MDISASGTFLSTRLNAVHFLERRCLVIMEKYASLKKQKKQFPAITVALLYFVHLNKGCYLYLSNLINWKNFKDFSIQSIQLLVHGEKQCVINLVDSKER